MLTSILLCSLAWAQPVETASYRYFLTGNAANVQVKTKPGTLLAGGGKDVEAAMRWFIEKAGRGDIVILRASGADGYHAFLMGLDKVDSVESIVFKSKDASSDPFVLEKIRNADGIFLAGGDQWNYIRFWKDTAVEDAIHQALKRGVPIGGTSAGLAVLGEYGFIAEHDTVTSPVALADAFHPKVSIGRDFLELPQLRCLITDSHFSQRDRMGRLLVFLGRIRQESQCREVRGMAIDERTAVLLEPDGAARVVGENAVFLLKLTQAPQLKKAEPVSLPPIDVVRVQAGELFDLKNVRGAASYRLMTSGGKVTSSLSSGGLYR